MESGALCKLKLAHFHGNRGFCGARAFGLVLCEWLQLAQAMLLFVH